MEDFIHLHNHSEYSLLDGLCKIPDLVAKAKEMNMKSLAITDHGVMYGTIPFYLECQKNNINPIIGSEIYVAPRSRFDKDPTLDRHASHLVLLCKNEIGYRNLIQIVTKAHLDGFYYRPRTDWETLEKYHEGLIALSACLQGVVMRPLMQGQEDEAERTARKYADLFGPDNFYLEIQKHRLDKQEIGNEKMIALAKKMNLPLVATNDIHYLNPEDAEAQEVLLCIQTQRTLLDKDRQMSMIDVPDFYFRSQQEMGLLFHSTPEALTNTAKIASQCNLTIPIGKMIMPVFPIPEGETFKSYLRQKAYEGAKARIGELDKRVTDRLDYELGVIDDKGYSAYFLIVSDFVTWGKNQKIAVGPGRGSAAGSLVSYCMRITDVNPLQYNLPFERFLNPERPSPPDIDMDFEDVRRDEIINYIVSRYGDDHAAQVITFGKMEAKAAVRDVGRVLGMPYSIPDKISKMIPQGSSIDEALQESSDLADAAREPEVARLLKLAKKVEGVARHASTHAAALVLSDKEITNYVPLTRESKGERVITQYDMYSLDLNVSEKAVGLLKFDLLGLRNLSTLTRCVQLIKYSQGIDLDLLKIDYNDPKVFEYLAKGETMGIFQMESGGMRRLAKDLRPNRFMDVAALIALYRPGPMDLIPQFVASKHDPSQIHYPHPDLKDILEESYGIPLYQEQVMLIASKMGGYTLGEADKLRKAMGKKKIEIMKKEKIKFIEGSVKRGYERKTAEEVFAMMEKFAGYGFGKAHSVCYAIITYQTAFVKYYYRIEFMTALLSAEAHNKDKLALLLNECNRMGIEVLKPDVNFSFKRFSIEGKNIRFGLSGIKNVGDGAIESIIENRQSGPYKSLSDFCQRVDLGAINKRVLESLIKSGACDDFGHRAAQLKVVEKILAQAQARKKEADKGMMGLFGDAAEEPLPEINVDNEPDFDKKQLLTWEKELMGIYLSENPLTSVIPELLKKTSHRISELDPAEDLNKRVVIGGMITDVRKIITKKNNSEMAFVKIEDHTGNLEVIVFPKTFADTKMLWREDEIVVVKGKIDNKDGIIKVLADSAKLITDAPLIEEFLKEQKAEAEKKAQTKTAKGKGDKKESPSAKTEAKPVTPPVVSEPAEALPQLIIEVPSTFDRQKLMKLYQILNDNPGQGEAVLIIDNNGAKRTMKLPLHVEVSEALKKEIDILKVS